MFLTSKSIFFFIFYFYSEVKMAYQFHNKIDFFRAVFSCCKTSSRKYIFSGNANFCKRKMFPWCLVAFQKIFWKKFSGVWKRRRKTQIQKNTSHNPDRAVDRDLVKARSRSSRDRVNGNLDPVQSRSRSGHEIRCDRDLDPIARSGAIAIARALCLSLSLIFRKYFEGKIEV